MSETDIMLVEDILDVNPDGSHFASDKFAKIFIGKYKELEAVLFKMVGKIDVLFEIPEEEPFSSFKAFSRRLLTKAINPLRLA